MVLQVQLEPVSYFVYSNILAFLQSCLFTSAPQSVVAVYEVFVTMFEVFFFNQSQYNTLQTEVQFDFFFFYVRCNSICAIYS